MTSSQFVANATVGSREDGPVRDDATSRPGLYLRFGKPLFDRLFVILSAPIALPLIGFAALVLLFSGGSPFYTQERVGRDGRTFRMLKLRSMVPNAEALLEDHLAANPDARREWDKHQKLANDPRITRFGHFLRRSSLDELPQLWNVLRGDMSIVGPRPMMPSQRSLYPGTSYYRLRPGITGLWQIADRHRTGFADRAAFDHAYLQSLSFKGDLKILARTAAVVLRATGC